MRISTFVPRLLAGGLFAGALLLTGCGGSDSPSSSSPQAGTIESSTVAAQSTAAAQTDLKPAAAAADQPRQGKVDPCTLLTEEQVAVAGEEPMLPGERSAEASPLGQQICTWGAVNEMSSRTVLVSVVRTQDMDEALRKQNYNAAQLYRGSKGLEGQAEPVSGVGDEAVRIQNELRALKGDVYLVVHVGGGPLDTDVRPSPVPTDTLKALAQAVFAKLGA